MRRNLEGLRYSTLAPSRYVVYLHPSEYARLEGIVPILQEQTRRALAEEIDTLNRRSRFGRYAERILGRGAPPVQNAGGGEWSVEFFPDPDGEMAEGDILIDSELLLPARPELGVGERTRRVTTVHSGQKTTMRERVADEPRVPPPQIRTLARIVYEDNAGSHTYDVVKDSVTIGRGGVTYPVDIKTVSSVDVSREHARIRRDAEGRFFLIDLSSLGTTLNGRHIPRGYDEAEGSKRENGLETALPDQARIGLAETVYLTFSVITQ
jgi:FHA domain